MSSFICWDLVGTAVTFSEFLKYFDFRPKSEDLPHLGQGVRIDPNRYASLLCEVVV